MLVVIAIIGVLAAIIYSAAAPARERAREVRCLSNLRQISQALQMYRQDYGGGEPPEALTAVQLGLPVPFHLIFNTDYLRDRGVLTCPSEYWPDEQPGSTRGPVSYMITYGFEDMTPPVPRFSEKVARRGDDAPLMVDPHHSGKYRGGKPPYRMLVLRLGGHVQRVQVPRGAPSWEW
jgi:type II secretory pathway pseudopilin PulG